MFLDYVSVCCFLLSSTNNCYIPSGVALLSVGGDPSMANCSLLEEIDLSDCLDGRV